MNYTIHHQRPMAAEGTGLRGYMLANKADIIEKLGQPLSHQAKFSKTYDEWIVTTDNAVLTIYDYKLPRRLDFDTDYYWHVGGNDGAVALAKRLFPHFKHFTIAEYLLKVSIH